MTFFYDGFSFPGKLVETPGLHLLSVLNIASAKAFTLNYRGKYRDYVDLYTIIKEQPVALERIMHNAQRIYGHSFSKKLFLGQLVYMEDLDPSDIKSLQWIGKPVARATIHHFFQQEMRRYLKKML